MLASIFMGWRLIVWFLTIPMWSGLTDNPVLECFAEFKETFGNEVFVYLVMSGRNLFEPRNTGLLRELEEEFK
jgi:hypothetical protein